MRTGRPLRFMGGVLVGWTALRVAMLWPGASPLLPEPVGAATLDPVASLLPQFRRGAAMRTESWPLSADPAPSPVAARWPSLPILAQRRPWPDGREGPVTLALADLARGGESTGRGPLRQAVTALPAGPGVLAPPFAPTGTAPVSRLGGSAWLLLRGGSTASAAPFGGQLGGSQAGARLTYALGAARRVALAARLSTPVNGRGREASLGVEWRPTRLPVRFVAEQRIGLDGSPGGPALGVIGGVGPVPVAAGFRLETYAQGGAIARDGVEGFVDGAARVTRPVVTIGGVAAELGIGVWGGAQRGARRLDLGPSLGVAVPVGQRRLRLSLDWRQRVAGDARPGSGPALSLGTDF